MFTVIGKPVTKKRARVGVGISKAGKKFRWAVTPDAWYEDYIREAFRKAFPGKKPIGWSLCEENTDMDEYDWELKKGVRDCDLPKVELDIIFYFDGGKIGDLDNYIKAIKDGLNQYAWIDDRQVHHYKPYIVTSKDFDDNALSVEPTRVDIYIRPFDLWNDKIFNSLRKAFEDKSTVIDMTDKYYNGEVSISRVTFS